MAITDGDNLGRAVSLLLVAVMVKILKWLKPSFWREKWLARKGIIIFPASKSDGSIKVYIRRGENPGIEKTFEAIDTLFKKQEEIFDSFTKITEEAAKYTKENKKPEKPDSSIVAEANKIIGGIKKPTT